MTSTTDAPPLMPTESVNYASGAPRRATHVMIPAILVLLFWIVIITRASLDLTTFVRFISGLVIEGLLVLTFALWWIFSRGRTLGEKSGILAIAAIGGFIAARLAAVEWFPFLLIAIPRIITAWVIWLIISRAFTHRAQFIGLIAVLAMAWGYHDALRMKGLWAEQKVELLWRWRLTPEQQFMAEHAKLAKAGSTSAPSDPIELQPRDWPNYLGPDRTGVVHGSTIRTDWSEHPPKRLFQSRAGPGWSSMIVTGGRLFTQEQRGEDDVVVCMDAVTGTELWAHADRTRFEEPLGGAGPRATPAFFDGKLYTLGAKGLLNCLDALTGQKIWSRDMPADAGGAPLPGWAFCSSPLVLHDKVIVFAGGNTGKALLAYDAKTGSIAWTSPVTGNGYCSPMQVKLLGEEQVLILTDTALTSVDPQSGVILWTYAAPMVGAPRAMNPQAFGDDSVIFASETDLGVVRLKIAKDTAGKWSASKTWQSKKLNAGYNQFVIQGNYLYGFDGSALTCLDLETGNRKWRGDRYGRGQLILLADQKLLLVQAETGEVVLLPAQPDAAPEELGRVQAIEGKTWNQPILVNDRLYTRNAEEIAGYGLTGKAKE